MRPASRNTAGRGTCAFGSVSGVAVMLLPNATMEFEANGASCFYPARACVFVRASVCVWRLEKCRESIVALAKNSFALDTRRLRIPAHRTQRTPRLFLRAMVVSQSGNPVTAGAPARLST